MWAPVVWMTGAGMVAWLAATLTLGDAVHPEALVGLAGPLASADASWVVMARAQAAGPDRLMAVMMRAMAVKMVLFGAYVALVLTVLDVRPVPFVASFAACFVGLYAMEVYFLKRLLESDVPQPAS